MNKIPPEYTLDGYIFPLPEELIAQEPPERRDASRLMVVNRADGGTVCGSFSDILAHLPECCLLVANNSRVIPARLHGSRASGGKVEFLLLTPPPLLRPRVCEGPPASELGAEEAWHEAEAEGLLKSSKQVRVGEVVRIAPDFHVEVLERGEFGRCTVRLFWQGEVSDILTREGSLPLPPYIRRPAGEADAERYQTTYARADKAGSVAAPTAGLHFTPKLRAAVTASGRTWAEVTLYVGYGTFSPVRCQDIREHPMHSEYVEVPLATARAIAKAKREGRAVIAVGTTSARVLEGVWEAVHCPEQTASRISVFDENGPFAQAAPEDASGQDAGGTRERVHAAPLSLEEVPGSVESRALAYAGWVNCFLYPGKAFHVVDGMITNFHLPGSSLLMLVSALAGRETILAAYAQAVHERFRFFSYGDAMLIL